MGPLFGRLWASRWGVAGEVGVAWMFPGSDFCTGTLVILMFWPLWSRFRCGFSCFVLVKISGVHQVARASGYSTRSSLCLWFLSLFFSWGCHLLVLLCEGVYWLLFSLWLDGSLILLPGFLFLLACIAYPSLVMDVFRGF